MRATLILSKRSTLNELSTSSRPHLFKVPPSQHCLPGDHMSTTRIQAGRLERDPRQRSPSRTATPAAPAPRSRRSEVEGNSGSYTHMSWSYPARCRRVRLVVAIDSQPGREGAPQGPRTMASRGACLGLLAWLLLLQLQLGEAYASAAPLTSSGPTGGEVSGASGQEGPTGESVAHTDAASMQTRTQVAPTHGPIGVLPHLLAFSSGEHAPVCGRPFLKIIGGFNAEEGKWPWQVSVRIREEHVCGGSLITAQWVLTAAHCIISHLQYSVKMGDRHLSTQKTSLVIPIRNIIVHPKFRTAATVINDIALLRLLYPVNFTSTIHPICVPSELFHVQTGTKCWVTGWGKTKQEVDMNSTEILQEVDQQIILYQECNEKIQTALSSKRDLVLKGMICGDTKKGKDSCQGDSGGPMSCEFNETWIQVGIVSWGIACGHSDFPGVYTYLSFYSKWVVATVNQAVPLYSVLFLILLECLTLPVGILVTL
ncbi:serine protease 42 [Marmota marmota marmota]|uniref:serine protease 42 n=1 Tax=Marmota marmota marmota TaxID=9994 RepID=UPI0020926AF9|nr:serine protease 42 [Marmota marmota marmota]